MEEKQLQSVPNPRAVSCGGLSHPSFFPLAFSLLASAPSGGMDGYTSNDNETSRQSGVFVYYNYRL